MNWINLAAFIIGALIGGTLFVRWTSRKERR